MKTLHFVLLLLLVASCKQGENTQSNPQPMSSWVIGMDSFTTNQVSISHSNKIGMSAHIGTKIDYFYYSSIVDALPENGSYIFNLMSNQYNSERPTISFGSRGNYYNPLDSGYLQVSRSNGIIHMVIDSVRFVNYNNSKDIKVVKASVHISEN